MKGFASRLCSPDTFYHVLTGTLPVSTLLLCTTHAPPTIALCCVRNLSRTGSSTNERRSKRSFRTERFATLADDDATTTSASAARTLTDVELEGLLHCLPTQVSHSNVLT